MSVFDTLIQSYEFNRARTLGTLDRIEKMENPEAALAWSPFGRAPVGWQLMHVAVTEEIFATERLAPDREPHFTDLWDRFRGGSTPDDRVPSAAEIRTVMSESRSRLLETLGRFTEADLETIPEALKERGLTIQTVLHILSWHESHHQGQVHIILNMYENQ